MFSRTIVLASTLALLPAVASAQGAPAPAPAKSQMAAAPRQKDSLWNGALLGAGVGAIVGALAGSAMIECSECAGFNVPLTFGVIGAGAGAGIGAGIDAMRHSRSNAPVTATRTRRLTVAPVFGKSVQALVAWIRF
jgi:hypothetical protein